MVNNELTDCEGGPPRPRGARLSRWSRAHAIAIRSRRSRSGRTPGHPGDWSTSLSGFLWVPRRKLALGPNPPLPRGVAAASATMISRSCSCLRTSIFAHRSADRSKASAYSKAQQGIVSPAPLAHRPAGEQQCKRHKPSTEFALPSHPKSKCDVSPKHGLTGVASPPNLVSAGQNWG